MKKYSRDRIRKLILAQKATNSYKEAFDKYSIASIIISSTQWLELSLNSLIISEQLHTVFQLTVCYN